MTLDTWVFRILQLVQKCFCFIVQIVGANRKYCKIFWKSSSRSAVKSFIRSEMYVSQITIEHIGVSSEAYNINKSDEPGDVKTILEIYCILKKGGTVIVDCL
ncbi:MAG: hypothetical protein JO327_00495 [Nitrososphaeraceae archaeon]|nr:hypothetical protein [Nitrososphaeraceae archaeon]MBV9666585.1 hypothetical protein [Nitrososphaeraceae archaeon]